jgi:hypothetical protein
MKVKDYITQLQELDPELEIRSWEEALRSGSCRTLTFDEAGKAIRILLEAIGKPFGNANADMSGHKYQYRDVIWLMNYESGGVNINIQRAATAITTLKTAGFNQGDYKITSDGKWFHIHIPFDSYYTAFTTSDDPEVWKQRQAHQEVLTAARLQRKADKRAKQSAEWEAEYAANKAIYEKQNEDRLKAEKEKHLAEAKQQLAEERNKLQQHAEMRAVDFNPERLITVEG